MMLHKELVNYQDKLYWVYRKIKQEQVKEGSITDLKDFWHCDVVVRQTSNNDNLLYFLKEIPEAELVSD